MLFLMGLELKKVCKTALTITTISCRAATRLDKLWLNVSRSMMTTMTSNSSLNSSKKYSPGTVLIIYFYVWVVNAADKNTPTCYSPCNFASLFVSFLNKKIMWNNLNKFIVQVHCRFFRGDSVSDGLITFKEKLANSSEGILQVHFLITNCL